MAAASNDTKVISKVFMGVTSLRQKQCPRSARNDMQKASLWIEKLLAGLLEPADQDVLAFHVDFIGGNGMPARMVGQARPDVEGPSMPRACDHASFEAPARQWSSHVRAHGIHRIELPVHVAQRHGFVVNHDVPDGACGYISEACNLDERRPLAHYATPPLRR